MSQNCILKSNKVFMFLIYPYHLIVWHKDKKDIQTAKKIGCNWIALSYLQNSKLIHQTRKLINKDMGIISKIENNCTQKYRWIIKSTDAIMIARGDLALDIGHSEVPKYS